MYDVIWSTRLMIKKTDKLFGVVNIDGKYHFGLVSNKYYHIDYKCSLKDSDFARIFMMFNPVDYGYLLCNIPYIEFISYKLVILDGGFFDEELDEYGKCMSLLIGFKSVDDYVGYVEMRRVLTLLVSNSMCFTNFGSINSEVVIQLSIPWEIGVELVNSSIDALKGLNNIITEVLKNIQKYV